MVDVQITGGIKLHIEVAVTPEQFATWDATRIRTFFLGIAMVVAARDATALLEELRNERGFINGTILQMEDALRRLRAGDEGADKG